MVPQLYRCDVTVSVSSVEAPHRNTRNLLQCLAYFRRILHVPIFNRKWENEFWA